MKNQPRTGYHVSIDIQHVETKNNKTIYMAEIHDDKCIPIGYATGTTPQELEENAVFIVDACNKLSQELENKYFNN